MIAARISAVVALLATLGATHVYVYITGKQDGTQETTARWARERLELKQAQLNEVQRAVQIEHHLTEKIAKIQHEASHEKRRITDQYERTIAGVRNRPEARADTSGVPQGATVGVGCTGAGLARPDGEFLSRYAADAARLQSALSTCIAKYNAVQQAVNGD